jgi:acetyltransferase-like isoleucine patch superfamily enzyme
MLLQLQRKKISFGNKIYPYRGRQEVTMGLFSRKKRSSHEDPLTVFGRAFRKLCTVFFNSTYPFASLGCGLQMYHSVELERSEAHRIKLGNWVRLRKDVRLQVHAPSEEKGEPVIILDDAIDIGARSTISARNSIHLEREVTLGQSVLIRDHSPAHQDINTPIKNQGFTEGGRIRIEKGCFIAQGAAILCDKGELVIGRNCIVAAHSLVTRSFPSYCLIAGNPARMVQQFDPVEGVWVLGGIRAKNGGKTK